MSRTPTQLRPATPSQYPAPDSASSPRFSRLIHPTSRAPPIAASNNGKAAASNPARLVTADGAECCAVTDERAGEFSFVSGEGGRDVSARDASTIDRLGTCTRDSCASSHAPQCMRSLARAPTRRKPLPDERKHNPSIHWSSCTNEFNIRYIQSWSPEFSRAIFRFSSGLP